MKRRNPTFGYRRIAHQLSLVFDIELDKDVVRRVLAQHYRPDPSDRGPSWLSLLGHTKDSLWSLDFFRCESLVLKSHWVMVVIDPYTRRIVGMAVHADSRDSAGSCDPGGREAGIPHFRFVRSTDTRHIDELLDEALEETLPASDSIAVTPERTR